MSAQTPTERSPGANFVHYLHVVRRRFWILIVPLILAPVIAYVLTNRQQSAFQSAATVYLSNLNLAQSLNGLPTDQSLVVQPDRAATTQANIARAPEVAKIALALAGVKGSIKDFLDKSAVEPEANADLLDFKVTNHDPLLAVRLATAYAKAFTQYSTQLQTTPLQTAYNDVTSRLKALARGGQKTSALYATLLQKQQQIVAIETLQTSDTSVVKSAGSAAQVAPRPKRAAILGFGIGLLIAIALVFVAEAVDNRVRSAEAIEHTLGYPLLARIPPALSRGKKAQTGLSMINDLGGAQAEAIRVLRTSLAFVSLKQKLEVLLVTSPRESDGKTTTAANLSIAFARSGRDVIVCDLDARKSSLPAAFGAGQGHPGLTDVVLGQANLDSVLKTIDVNAGVFDPRARLHAYGQRPRSATSARDARPETAAGKLQILSFGTFRPPNPGEFISTDAVRDLLSDLRSRTDLVIIDSPPILSVGDALILSANVDAILLAIRATTTTRGDLAETRRLLEGVPSTTIGFVLTDTRSAGDAYGYGYGYSGSSPLEAIALDTAAPSDA
jgi:Mrp family chromosome partitioning ATPase/capsular polysaccharide biosynthesis protein